VSGSHNEMFDHIQKNANINSDDILGFVDSLENVDLSDDQTVRNLIKDLSMMANQPLTKEKENKLVETIKNNDLPNDLNSLSQLFKK
jgi:hypothetical protein